MPKGKPLRQQLLDQLPGMPALLNHADIKYLRETYPTLFINDVVRHELDRVRRIILEATESELEGMTLKPDEIALRAMDIARRAIEPSVKPVINAAGVILHTALGRAPLAPSVKLAMQNALQGYCTLAINQESGKRGDRHLHLDRLLSYITGAEAGMIVNNNAAATMLILHALAAGKEVIVSRGQLIEIGGMFRIPEVMERSGCKLVEVGTTNRTHLRDYENAITENTGIILRVHTSNYAIIGFTHEVSLEELSALGKKRGIPVVDDLGSGALYDLSQFGLPKEPMVQESVQSGVDVICFSGDKMLGGPQGGFIIGKRELIEKIKRNPLMRALRCDKLSYVAAEATLKLYLEPEKLYDHHPVFHMITEPSQDVKKRAMSLKRMVAPKITGKADVVVSTSETEMGSGSLPGKTIPSYALWIKPKHFSPDEYGRKLRVGNPPVFTRIAEGCVVVDLRTVLKGEEKVLALRLVKEL
jgi:L-seryl-tRNA(Ser) seleniumtransferase